MSVKIELYPRVIVVTMNDDFDVDTDITNSADWFAQYAPGLEESIYLVIDFRPAVDLVNMNNITNGAFLSAPLLHHPKIREVLFVAVSDLMQAVATGMDTTAYGNLKVKLFSTVEDALDYVQAR